MDFEDDTGDTALVRQAGSGLVQGIHLISLIWTANGCRLPSDFRLYNKAQDGLSKNDHFQDLLQQAAECSFEPELVMFDSWYSGLPNLKKLGKRKWDWLTQLMSNRDVSLDRSGNRAICEIFIISDVENQEENRFVFQIEMLISKFIPIDSLAYVFLFSFTHRFCNPSSLHNKLMIY